MVVENWYTVPDTTLVEDTPERRLLECNAKAMYSIQGHLIGSKFVKVMHCTLAKEIQDKLKNVYEGYGKVKGAKIKTYIREFEYFTMKEDEDITTYFLQVDEIVNTMRGLGEKVESLALVQKILKSLPMRFDSKVPALEERQDLDKLSIDELHKMLTTYEMRTKQEKPSRKETPFKVSKKTNKNYQKPKSCSCSSCSEDLDDEEEANFLRNLK